MHTISVVYRPFTLHFLPLPWYKFSGFSWNQRVSPYHPYYRHPKPDIVGAGAGAHSSEEATIACPVHVVILSLSDGFSLTHSFRSYFFSRWLLPHMKVSCVLLSLVHCPHRSFLTCSFFVPSLAGIPPFCSIQVSSMVPCHLATGICGKCT